jgi:phosphoglycolate phosphatase-like HAD superfamily hydrolase
MLISNYSYNCKNISKTSQFEEIPKMFQENFLSYRYLVGPAYEYYILWDSINEEISQNKSIDTIFYEKKSSIDFDINEYIKLFYDNRKKLKNYHFDKWTSLNPFYKKISNVLLKANTLKNIFIVTSKDTDSVIDLLSVNNIQIPSKNIYGYEKSFDKKELFNLLISENNIKINEISFIDDKLSHLINVSSLGIKCYLALWGYISNNSKKNAEKLSIRPLEEHNFTKILTKIVRP